MTETNLFLLANGKLDVYNKFEGLKHLGSLIKLTKNMNLKLIIKLLS